MLPEKAFQINYQDYSFLVLKDIEIIKEWERNNGNFDFILGKLRNGTFPASIIANDLQIPMGVVEAPRHIDYKDYRVFLPYECLDNKKYKVLLVDSLCGTGGTLKKIKDKLKEDYSNLEVITYCPITDYKVNTKPDLLTLEIKEFIQPPWELRSFTPQAHLDRLENYDIKASEEKDNCIGFSTIELQKNIEQFLGYSFFRNFNFQKEFEKINSTSGISVLEISENGLNSFNELNTTYINLIKQKEKFIKDNGITHFFEYNLKQAILLSQLCAITKIIYFEDNTMYKLQSFETKLDN